MQLGVLVDRMIDPHQQPLGLEIRQMLLQVEPRSRVRRVPDWHHVIHNSCHPCFIPSIPEAPALSSVKMNVSVGGSKAQQPAGGST